jgi:hydrogenase maturation protease
MINVLGIGNVLMGDDGFGPAVVWAFDAAYQTGPDVDVVDIGTPGLDLMPWFADVDRLVIVDTVKSSLPPGTLRLYDKGGVLRHAPSVRVGPHDPGVKEALLTLEFAGRAPREVTLIGVVPARTDLALDLSPAVEAAVAPAVQALVDTLERFGVCVTRRYEVVSKPTWCPPSGGLEVQLKPDATGFET